jgi:uncharacterized protein (DUF302 family)
MTSNSNSGIVVRKSAHSVDETVQRFEQVLRARNIKLFTIIHHSGEAEQAGLRMPNTKLVIFGNPKAGTPIMLASPSAGIDLPLKILVSEDSAGGTWLTYNSTSYLQARHGFPQSLAEKIAGVSELVIAASE